MTKRDFWEEFKKPGRGSRSPARKSAEPSSQNDCAGVCHFCGYASDDVLIGVCEECA